MPISVSSRSAMKAVQGSSASNSLATSVGMTSQSTFSFSRCRGVKMMSRDQLVSQAQVIFREVLDSPDLVLTDDLTAPKVEGWDSLNHVTLVMTLEEQFRVKFTTREVMGWRNVGQMLDCLQGKLSK